MADRTRTGFRIAAPFKGLAQRFAYLGLVVSAFALMMLGKADTVLVERLRGQVTDAVAPILDVASRPLATVADVVARVRELADLGAENVRLREERDRLLQWQTVARRLEAENRSLKTMLNFNPDPDASFVTARVIADTGGVFANSVLLNAGAREGVVKGMAAITGEGLVGRVSSVGARSSRVLLITDLNSHIPVLMESTGTRAILAGDNTDTPRLVHLPPGATASPGERVVTSGHGGVFPPRLPIGIVVSVNDSGIRVRPFVDRDRLEYVRVVDFGLDGILRLPTAPVTATAPARAPLP